MTQYSVVAVLKKISFLLSSEIIVILHHVSMALVFNLLLATVLVLNVVQYAACRTECSASGGGFYYCPKDDESSSLTRCCTTDEPDSCCSTDIDGWIIALIIVGGFLVILCAAIALCCCCGWRPRRTPDDRHSLVHVKQAHSSYGVVDT